MFVEAVALRYQHRRYVVLITKCHNSHKYSQSCLPDAYSTLYCSTSDALSEDTFSSSDLSAVSSTGAIACVPVSNPTKVETSVRCPLSATQVSNELLLQVWHAVFLVWVKGMVHADLVRFSTYITWILSIADCNQSSCDASQAPN